MADGGVKAGFGPDVRREPDAAAEGEDELLYMLDLGLVSNCD